MSPRKSRSLVDALGHSGADYLEWSEVAGREALDRCIEEGHDDHIFGVPIFLFEEEAFWGHDRIPLLEERLRERGLQT